LARELTEVVARLTGCDATTARVLITGYSREDWAVGGILEADRNSTQSETG
jgi:phenylpyruvate tautomerase PptA (4-oxalocrotonate tautomerase family)